MLVAGAHDLAEPSTLAESQQVDNRMEFTSIVDRC